MTRLQNKVNMGFVALQLAVLRLLKTHIAPTEFKNGRILDPCAGEGVALREFAEHLGMDAYGVELNEARALKARTHLDESDRPSEVLCSSFHDIKATNDSFHVIYLNPPYDYDDSAGRLEYRWLRDSRPMLQPGGLLIYVIPRHVIGSLSAGLLCR